MLGIGIIAFLLVATTVTIHAVGLSLIARPSLRFDTQTSIAFWPITWLLIRVAWELVLLHVIAITVWALFYRSQGCLPDVESAFYFSGTTYTTVGYGDLVLPLRWRMLGPVEALTGILMCGLSTGFFFAIVSRIAARRANLAA